MQALRDFALERIVAFPHSSHYTEFLIRETSIVATTGRGEVMRSSIVVSRQAVNPEVAERTIASNKGKGGTQRPPRGCQRNMTLVEVCVELVKAAIELEPETGIGSVREQLKQGFYDNANASKKVRQETYMNAVKNAPMRNLNALQKKTGVHRTPAMLGMVDMSKLRAADHREALKAEASARNLVPKQNFLLLKKQMREADKQKKSWFKPKTLFFQRYLRREDETTSDSDHEADAH